MELDPDGSSINGNYANFLLYADTAKKDHESIEKHYLKALVVDPGNAYNYGNYALFLQNIKKDYKASEKHYLRALTLDPEHANNNENYAGFLHNAKKDYNAAEKHYRKAVEIEPNDADFNGNYAGFLFSIGNHKSAEKHLQLAPDNASPGKEKNLLLECYFYEYAHITSKRKNAETELLKLLELGVSSLGFELSQNVDRAIKDGHSSPDKLRDYAQRISAT